MFGTIKLGGAITGAASLALDGFNEVGFGDTFAEGGFVEFAA